MGAIKLDADDALGRHEWLIAPPLLQGKRLAGRPNTVGAAAGYCLAGFRRVLIYCASLTRLNGTQRRGTPERGAECAGQLTVSVQPLAKPSEEERFIRR